jgi:DNA-binding transcriptional regulator YhcF (GntR family)
VANIFKVMKDAGTIGYEATQLKYLSEIVEDMIDRLIKEKRVMFKDDNKVVYTNRQNITKEYTFSEFSELTLDTIKSARKCGVTSTMVVEMLKAKTDKDRV